MRFFIAVRTYRINQCHIFKNIEIVFGQKAIKRVSKFTINNYNLKMSNPTKICIFKFLGNIEDQKAKEEHIGEILSTIEEHGLMSPLLVIRTLAGSPLANLGIVRQYLLNVYKTEEKQINDHTKVIGKFNRKFH